MYMYMHLHAYKMYMHAFNVMWPVMAGPGWYPATDTDWCNMALAAALIPRPIKYVVFPPLTSSPYIHFAASLPRGMSIRTKPEHV